MVGEVVEAPAGRAPTAKVLDVAERLAHKTRRLGIHDASRAKVRAWNFQAGTAADNAMDRDMCMMGDDHRYFVLNYIEVHTFLLSLPESCASLVLR